MDTAVGTFLPPETLMGGMSAVDAALARVEAGGIDHVGVGDHVSFFTGIGFDGLLSATSLLSLHPTMPVHVGVYLLALRHPVLVARQLADLSLIAPGRLVLGVGVGGEDPHEFEVCGVNPATRGARTDEALRVVRRLLAGEAVDNDGPHFPLRQARILPVPAQPVPIVVGGRSDAALRRVARLGDGWLALFVSARRFAEAVEQIDALADADGRDGVGWRHGLQVWCGFGSSREDARAALAPQMEGFYQLPFEKFERYAPYGTPEDVAAHLFPYMQAGCRTFNLIPRAADPDAALDGVAEVRARLAAA